MLIIISGIAVITALSLGIIVSARVIAGVAAVVIIIVLIIAYKLGGFTAGDGQGW